MNTIYDKCPWCGIKHELKKFRGKMVCLGCAITNQKWSDESGTLRDQPVEMPATPVYHTGTKILSHYKITDHRSSIR